jgi:hypothetical protein
LSSFLSRLFAEFFGERGKFCLIQEFFRHDAMLINICRSATLFS